MDVPSTLLADGLSTLRTLPGLLLPELKQLPLTPECYSARRFDADRRANSLRSLDSGGQISAPNNSRVRRDTEMHDLAALVVEHDEPEQEVGRGRGDRDVFLQVRGGRCRSGAFLANCRIPSGLHRPSVRAEKKLGFDALRWLVLTPHASLMQVVPRGPLSCPFGDYRGQLGSRDCWTERPAHALRGSSSPGPGCPRLSPAHCVRHTRLAAAQCAGFSPNRVELQLAGALRRVPRTAVRGPPRPAHPARLHRNPHRRVSRSLSPRP